MIHLGIIGTSPGNGHPYSWAAIFNGFNQDAMAQCPFPVIPDYLSKQSYPDDFIHDARVTHIWTQDEGMTEHIAISSNIPHKVKTYRDMIAEVDGLLLARDDYENHARFATPFLKKGLPVYIDKPLANDMNAAKELLMLQTYEGQIFTCSALRYAREFESVRSRAKDIRAVRARTPKKWGLYGIHIVEPVVALLYEELKDEPCLVQSHNCDGERVDLDVLWGKTGLHFESSGTDQGALDFTFTFGDGSEKIIQVQDVFFAFRSALQAFLESIKHRKAAILREETLACIQMIELGRQGAVNESLRAGSIG